MCVRSRFCSRRRHRCLLAVLAASSLDHCLQSRLRSKYSATFLSFIYWCLIDTTRNFCCCDVIYKCYLFLFIIEIVQEVHTCKRGKKKADESDCIIMSSTLQHLCLKKCMISGSCRQCWTLIENHSFDEPQLESFQQHMIK